MSRPITVTIASLVIAVQGLAVFGLTAWTAFQFFGQGQATLHLGVQIAMLAIYVMCGLMYMAVGHFMFRGKGWTRSAAVAIELLVVILAFSFFTANNPLATTVGVLMLISGAVVIGCLFTQSAGQYLGQRTTAPARSN